MGRVKRLGEKTELSTIERGSTGREGQQMRQPAPQLIHQCHGSLTAFDTDMDVQAEDQVVARDILKFRLQLSVMFIG